MVHCHDQVPWLPVQVNIHDKTNVFDEVCVWNWEIPPPFICHHLVVAPRGKDAYTV